MSALLNFYVKTSWMTFDATEHNDTGISYGCLAVQDELHLMSKSCEFLP